MPNLYFRYPGLPFIHNERSDGGSRSSVPVVANPRATILPGSLVASRAVASGLLAFNPAGTDGSQTLAGIAIDAIQSMTQVDTKWRRYPCNVSVLTSDAEVIGSRLIWPDGITADQKAVAVAQLAALGIEVV